jgi:hypothetical protein
MLAAAVAAFFYLRVALIMYGSAPDTPSDGASDSDAAAGYLSTAGLEPVPSLDGAKATATLLAPSTDEIVVPLSVVAVLAICAAFTIAAGVSSVVVDFAHQATTLF